MHILKMYKDLALTLIVGKPLSHIYYAREMNEPYSLLAEYIKHKKYLISNTLMHFIFEII